MYTYIYILYNCIYTYIHIYVTCISKADLPRWQFCKEVSAIAAGHPGAGPQVRAGTPVPMGKNGGVLTIILVKL